MKLRRNAKRPAFTLIELVASAVLTAMMMVGLMGIVWSTSRDLSRLRRDAVDESPSTILVDRIRTDLSNARGMKVDGSGMTLHGFMGHDPKTMNPTLTETSVRYEVRRLAGQLVLIRTERGLPSEPVWLGLSRIQIESFVNTDAEDELMPLPEAGGLPPVPSIFRITLLGSQGQVMWREVIHHHDI